MLVGGVEVFAAKIEAGVVMGNDAGGIGGGGTSVFFIGSVEHQVGAIQLEPSPVAVVPRLRGLINLEAQHVAIKADSGGHIENLQQGTDTVNVHDGPSFGGNIAELEISVTGVAFAELPG